MFSAILNIVLGLGMVIAGAAERAVLIGTGSSLALALAGVLVGGYGGWQYARLLIADRSHDQRWG